MISNKKGLSTVVTTLIIILLVLVAIGIIWIVVRGVIETGTETVDYAVKCLAVDVRATGVACSGASDVCNVTLARKAGGDSIGGVKMVFYNNVSLSSSVFDSRTEQGGNLTAGIEVLTTATTIPITVGLNNTNKVEVTVYFLDESGEDQICSVTRPFSYA